MKALLNVAAALYSDLMGHLLPPGGLQEQAAFLFAQAESGADPVMLNVIEAMKLTAADFDAQEGDYLEMADATRARLIKRAHDIGASLVEMHSHPGRRPAAFSLSDRMGLKETVPHMWWRLKRRPYLAIVVAPSGFDALLWLDNARVPQALDGMLAGDRLLRPTNRSLGGWS